MALYLCANNKISEKPFVFNAHKMYVYTLEEALYYGYHNWQQVYEDLFSEKFIAWVEDFGSKKLAEKLQEYVYLDNFSEKLLGFLGLQEYFSKDELAWLEQQVIAWESRHYWERIKEQGDIWANAGDFEKALGYYRLAHMHQENPNILNNIGICLMKLSRFVDAAEYFEKAYLVDKNMRFRYNLIEAYIYAQNFDLSNKLIDDILSKNSKDSEAYYMRGEVFFANKRYFEAINMYQNAIELAQLSPYIYRLCDCFVNIRLYDRALDALEKVADRDSRFYAKQAELYAVSNNLPMAIKCIEKAILQDGKSVGLWTTLAQYCRKDYDTARASAAISKALSIAKNDAHALFEYALIRKAQGRMKEYQDMLHTILVKFKDDYRENLKISGGI